MSTVVVISPCKADRAMEIVRELRKQGLVQHVDFDFSYFKATYDEFSYSHSESKAAFTFYQERHSTFFALKFT